MPVQMRMPKFPHLLHTGLNAHMALPIPPVVPLPVPTAGWLVLWVHPPSFIYGKYSDRHVATEGMSNTLFGHDWGPLQPHMCVFPTTHVPTPSTPLVMLGSSHKFWLPSYSVKEPASGGVLAAIGGSATTAVAVCFSSGFIPIQDCQDTNGVGFVLPFGFNFALPTTHWVGFGWLDFLAGLTALAFDCVAAILLSKLSNGSKHFSKYGDMAKAFIGLGIGLAGSALQGLMARYNAPPWLQVAVGVLLIAVDKSPRLPDHSGPAGAGLVGGGLADMIGGRGWSGDERGERDPYFDNLPAPPPATPQPASPPPAPTAGPDAGVPDATAAPVAPPPPATPIGPPAPPPQNQCVDPSASSSPPPATSSDPGGSCVDPTTFDPTGGGPGSSGGGP